MAEVEVGMRILVIADIESKALWDYFDKSMLENVDLIVSCGDLNPKYLSFLATFTKAPVIYVRGNHDANYEMTPPDGCICIEDDIFEFHGVRLLGLGGSMRYKEGSNMFTENEMKKRVNKMRFKLRKKDGFDILVTPIERTTVTTAARPSGIAATARLTESINISSTAPPSRPVPDIYPFATEKRNMNTHIPRTSFVSSLDRELSFI